MPDRRKRPFEDVYEDHFSYIYNFVYMHLLHRESAEDVTSEAFMRAYAAYDRYDPALASERTWLCTIANRLLINRYRSRSSSGEDLVGDEVLNVIPDPDEALEQLTDTTNLTVQTLLTQLTEEERHMLLMRYYMDMKNPEIADELGISAKAVSERYRRLVEKCRKLMETDAVQATL